MAPPAIGCDAWALDSTPRSSAPARKELKMQHDHTWLMDLAFAVVIIGALAVLAIVISLK